MKESALKNFALPLKYLTTLRLTIDAHGSPHPRCWNGLGYFLRSIRNLKYLRFGFAPFNSGGADRGTWQYAEDDLAQWYAPLWRMLGSHTWKSLSTLRLDGLLVCETGLSELLIRHASVTHRLSVIWISSTWGFGLAASKDYYRV